MYITLIHALFAKWFGSSPWLIGFEPDYKVEFEQITLEQSLAANVYGNLTIKIYSATDPELLLVNNGYVYLCDFKLLQVHSVVLGHMPSVA